MDRSRKKRLRDFLYRSAHYLCVCRCISCEEIIAEDEVLCEDCEPGFQMARLASCGICDKPVSGCLCATDALRSSGIRRHVKLYYYDPNDPESVGNRILYRLKVRNIATRFRFLGACLADRVRTLVRPNEDFFVTFVPRAPARVLDYGHDQSRELALEMSLLLDLPMAPLLKRSRRAHTQKDLKSAKARKENIQSSLTLGKDAEALVSGKTVLLVDDIVTSGASMGVAAGLLRKAGAREVIAVSVAVVNRTRNLKTEAEKNSRIPFYMR